MMEERFSRIARLVGEEALDRLRSARVLLVGLGGVGGYACEALARAGVGTLYLVDADRVSESNINRQILADDTTVGRPKAAVAAERVARINPAADVHPCECFVDEQNVAALFAAARPDYVIDAIDTVSGKVALIRTAHAAGIPVISCMGTGNKLEADKLQIADIAKTSVCPLCRVMRVRLRKEGILHLPVLFSTETPRTPQEQITENGRHIPASISYVPAVAGLLIAGHVIRDLMGEKGI